MQNTPNFGLRKPEQTDFYNVDDFNYNADVIDEKLKEIEDGIKNITADDVGAETPAGAQAKADAALAAAKAYTDQEVTKIANNLASHKNDKVAHITSAERTTWNSKADANIREDINKTLKVEVVSSSESESPDAGRIIFDTSQGKFFGGNGSGWV